MSGNLNRQLSAQEFDAKLSLADFIVGDSDDPLVPPLAFTQWRQAGAWEATLYEPELLATADARTTINYEGKPRSVINLCSYNYAGCRARGAQDPRNGGMWFAVALRNDRSSQGTGTSCGKISRPRGCDVV